ncbi:hypothetical protein A4X09_0g4281 [Tilletia walkeri]|uniref:Uncharacterized protein n=1 Tax=Tilletia walkeri TaxID=117179 RepID=A0A8X7N9F1_9BASI|nr:hypothetical protein A4X09_0g4281 [Tilletia walkeri]
MARKDVKGKRKVSSRSDQPAARRTRPRLRTGEGEQHQDEELNRTPKLPSELIKLILEYIVASLDEEPKQIHFKQNHPNYNRRLAVLSGLICVNKTFYHFLLPHLYNTLILPRDHGHSHSASCIDDPLTPTLHDADADAAILATQLAKRPHLRTLVKKIHISPVVRLRGNDDDDAAAYTKIIRSCKDTVEELAIALHACSGAQQAPRLLTATDSHQLLAGLRKRISFPSLRHLTLEFKEQWQLDAIEWDKLPQLRSVTLLTENIFGQDRVNPTFAVDWHAPQYIYEGRKLYEALSLLPSSVTTVTFGFTGLSHHRIFPNTRLHNLPIFFLDEEFEYFTTSLNKAFRQLVDDNTQEGEDSSTAYQLQLLRLVWIHRPLNGDWCDVCLRGHRTATHDLPKLRRMTMLERQYSESLEPAFRVGSVPGSQEASSSPKLEMYEVHTTNAWQASLRDHFKLTMCKLELLWKALLYNSDGDTLAWNAPFPPTERPCHSV